MQRRLLSGTYECSLDNRFRVAIPARLRAPFADGVVVARGLDPCLVVFPGVAFTEVIEREFGATSLLDTDGRALSRFLTAWAFEQELDRQGRILVPAELRAIAGLDGRVKVVGRGDHLEVWDPERLAADFDELLREGVSERAKRLLADRRA